MPTESTLVSYSARCSAFERERLYLLAEPGLRVRETGRPERLLPYHAMRHLCLTHTVSRYIRDLYRCRILMADGSKLVLSNQHYLGGARFRDQGPEYAIFMRALHQRLLRGNTVFEQGPGIVARYAMWSLGLGLALFLAILLLVGLAEGNLLLLLAAMAGVLPLGGVMYLIHNRNRPQAYRPEAIPPELLPAED